MTYFLFYVTLNNQFINKFFTTPTQGAIMSTVEILLLICFVITVANLFVGLGTLWHSRTNRRLLQAIVAHNDAEVKKILDGALDV